MESDITDFTSAGDLNLMPELAGIEGKQYLV